jgi:NADH:ubiquinone oxidoreductase subunit 4 (subunit M)
LLYSVLIRCKKIKILFYLPFSDGAYVGFDFYHARFTLFLRFFRKSFDPYVYFHWGLGARERKIKAAYLFFLYTLFGSLVMLFGVLYLYVATGSTSFFVLLNTTLDADQQKLI